MKKVNINSDTTVERKNTTKKTRKVKGMKKNMQLCVDLKTFLVEDSLPLLDKSYHGVLNQEREDLVCFVEEELPKRGPKNQMVFHGHYITVSFSKKHMHYWWRFINDNMSSSNPESLVKEYKLAQKTIAEHSELFGLVEKGEQTQTSNN